MPSYQAGAAAGLSGISGQNRSLGAAYPISLPVFEGPLDLLLHLIEQEKLDINEVSLVMVTDQYLRTIEQLEELSPGALADFLVVASRLLYIKSMRLLPKPAQPDDEEEGDAESLVRHLLEYRQIKRAASGLRAREDAGGRLFVRPSTALDVGELLQKPLDFGDINPAMLQNALRQALGRIPVIPTQPTLQPYLVTVAEQIEVVRSRIADAQRLHTTQPSLAFAALLGACRSRVEIIVTFLAVLELVKQRELVAFQELTFGEIVLQPVGPAEATAYAEENDPENGLAAATDPE